jgi:hypothetical protein
VSDKHLERKEVLNIVYTQQAERMADAYARLMSDFSQMTAWGRGLESDLSWARAELLMVKAEVERLTQLNSTLALRYDATNSMLDGCAKEIEEMEAEVERLTKAGDVMASEFQTYFPLINKMELVDNWHAAKEGKQS